VSCGLWAVGFEPLAAGFDLWLWALTFGFGFGL